MLLGGAISWLMVNGAQDLTALPWVPNAITPPAGLPAWAQLTRTVPPAVVIPGNVPLMILSRTRATDLVRASNGWRGYVDAYALEPGRASPAPAAGPPPPAGWPSPQGNVPAMTVTPLAPWPAPVAGSGPNPPPEWASIQPATTGAGAPMAAPSAQTSEHSTVESAVPAAHAAAAPASDGQVTAALTPAFFGPSARPAITGSAQPRPAPEWPWTHLVPAGGIPAWAAPDPSRPPVVNLAERVQLVVDQRAGDWALVRAQNGWSGWVDARRLVPRP
jgi:hypothetical protein